MYNTSARIRKLQKMPSTRWIMAVNSVEIGLKAASTGELAERGRSYNMSSGAHWFRRCSTDAVRALHERLESFHHFIS